VKLGIVTDAKKLRGEYADSSGTSATGRIKHTLGRVSFVWDAGGSIFAPYDPVAIRLFRYPTGHAGEGVKLVRIAGIVTGDAVAVFGGGTVKELHGV
jgi:hypothetical protein